MVLSSTVKSLKDHTFENCPSLKLYYRDGDGFRIITGRKDEYVLYDNDTVIVIGGTIFVDGTIYLGTRLPSNVKKVFLLIPDPDKNSYRKIIKQLTATDSSEPLVIEVDTDLEDFGDSAFENAVFPGVKILEGVKSLGKRVFANCPNLTLVELPHSLKEIGDEAFADCTALVNIVIPSKVENVGNNVFSGCKSLEKIFYWAGANFVDKLQAGNSAKTIPYYRFDLPDGVTIESNPVFKTGKLNYFAETIWIKNSTGVVDVKIQSDTFTANGYTFTFDGVDTFTVTEDVNKIMLDAAVSVEAQEIAVDAEIDLARKKIVPPNIIDSGTCGANVTWTFDGDTLTISGTGYMYNYSWQVNSKQINSPWYINRTLIKSVVIEDGVISIGDYALYKCTNLISVTIPNGVIFIGDRAFYECTNLTSVTIPNGVKIIGEYAFYWCESLSSITIPDSVTRIHDDAFCSCKSLTNMTIPASVESFGVYVFGYCDKLENVTFLCDIDKIPNGTFNSCRSLKSVRLPDGITEIAKDAFKSCTSLTGVEIPNGVTIINHDAFDNCKSLSSVRLPASLSKIGNRIFNRCKKLGRIYYKSGTPIDNDAFKSKLRDGNKA